MSNLRDHAFQLDKELDSFRKRVQILRSEIDNNNARIQSLQNLIDNKDDNISRICDQLNEAF